MCTEKSTEKFVVVLSVMEENLEIGHPPVSLEESGGSTCVVIERCQGLSKTQVTEVFVWCYPICVKKILC